MRTRSSAGRVWRKFVLSSTALAALMLVAAASASAGTLDQQQTNSGSTASPLFTTLSGAQTFTASISGGLDQADLKVQKLGTPPPVVNVEIRSTSAGSPTATVLASGTIPASAVSTDFGGAFASVTFAAPAAVISGVRYALVAWSPGTLGNSYGWYYQDTGNPYSAGSLFTSMDPVPPAPGSNWGENANADYAFKTYVVPTPSSGSGHVNPITCKGQQATQVGTRGSDVISGTAARDVIAALEGNDSVSGLAGNDLICGGSGKDTLKGGAGNDKLLGEGGKDKLKGGGGRDICKGGKGKDTASKCEVEKSI